MKLSNVSCPAYPVPRVSPTELPDLIVPSVTVIAQAGRRPQVPSAYRYWPVSDRKTWARNLSPLRTRDACTHRPLSHSFDLILPRPTSRPATVRVKLTSRPRTTLKP